MVATMKHIIFIIFIAFLKISYTKKKTFKRLQHNPKKEELCHDDYSRSKNKKEFSVAPMGKDLPKISSNINSRTIGQFKSWKKLDTYLRQLNCFRKTICVEKNQLKLYVQCLKYCQI